MVSFLSFFSSKKKSKKLSPRSSSPTGGRDGSGSGSGLKSSALGSPSPKRNEPPRTDSKGSSTSSAVRASNGGKFLSLSSRSASKPYDLAQRRTSSEVGRSGKRGGGSFRRQSSANGTTAVPVPKLNLAWELPGEGERDLGLSDVGVRPRLTDEERRALDGLKLGVEEVKEAWTLFGNQLRQTGVDSPGVLLPRRPDADVESQLYLLALFTLAIRPSSITSFPSIIAHFPSSSPSPDSPDLWRDRFLFALKDLHSVPDLCECLKWTLRHLVIGPKSSTPLIEAATYTSFVQNEHASSYPKDAYHTIFLPLLSITTAQLLEEVFEICAAIATHADTNGMPAGRVCLFLGWWLQGARKSAGTWEELYSEWKEAGRRTEHLFYAWVRFQSTKGKIPTRLLDLVEDYPFGESSASSEHLPLPPPSSFSRTSLHVTLSSNVPLDKVSLSLRDLANTALSAPIAEEGTAAAIWEAVRESVDGDGDGECDGDGDGIAADVFSAESRSFLSSIAETGVNSTNGSPGGRSPDGSALSTPKRTHSRKRSQSHGAITSSLDTPSPKFPRPSLDILSEELAHLPSINGKNEGPGRGLTKQTSTGMLRSAPTPASWDDFISAGFADAAEQRDLTLALSTSSTFDSLSSVGPATPSVENGKPITKRPSTLAQPASIANAANVHYVVVGEETLEIDDVFMGFVEDGQLDASASSKWPPFTLVRLATARPTEDPSKPIEWLLITLDYRPPAPIAPSIREVAPTERPISPSMSTTSRFGSAFGLSSIAGGFRRSSSFGQNGSFRKSIFGGSKRSNSRTGRGEGLSTLAEGTTIVDGAAVPNSAVKAAPTNYAVGEMGEIVRVSSANANPVEATSTTLAGDPPAAADPKPTIVVGDLPVPHGDPSVATDPSAETAASDWSYIGEGGAHILFAYHGPVASWNKRVLRIRKRKANPDDAAQQALSTWRSELLPQLLPTTDLLLPQKVHVEGSWLRQVVDAAKGERSEARIAENALEELGDVSVMGNAIGPSSTGTRTLAMEIKPKWGFLPSARYLQPPESADVKTHHCRFCMHKSLRYPESGGGPRYCPLDLYSGDSTRMRKALDALWGAWRESGGANNNWRVFVDGKVVLPEDADLIPSAEGGPLSSMTSPFVLPLLQSSGVLDRLRTLQSTLDPTDISDLVARFRTAHEGSAVFDPTLVPEPTADELQEVVSLYLSNPSHGSEDDGWTLRQRLVLHALSAIFKDCSIIVRAVLRPAGDGEHFLLDEQESEVRVIDLDLKPMASLRKWAELDDKIWRNQLAAGTGTGEVCVDSTSHPNAQEKEREREADMNDQDGRRQIQDENGLAVPLKPKALTNLSPMSGLDNASTTAVFMPTPETSVYGTPRSGSINEEGRAEIVEAPTHGDVAKDGRQAEVVKGTDDVEQGDGVNHEAAIVALGTAGAIAGIATTAAVLAHKAESEHREVEAPAPVVEAQHTEAPLPSTVSEQCIAEGPERDTNAALTSSQPAEDIAVAPPAEAKVDPTDTVSTIETSAPSSPVVSRRERSPGPSPSPTRGEYLEEAPVEHEEAPVEHEEAPVEHEAEPVVAAEVPEDEKAEEPLKATLPRSEQEVPLTSDEETAQSAVHPPSHNEVEAEPAVALSHPESATEPESPAAPPLVVPQPEHPADKSIITPSEAPTPSLVSDVPTPPSSSSPATILRPRTYEEAALEIAGFPPPDIAQSSQNPGLDASAAGDPGVIPERDEAALVDETQRLPREAAMTAPSEPIGVGEVSLADVQASLADEPAVAEESLGEANAMLVEQDGEPRVIPVEDLPPIYNPPEEPVAKEPRAEEPQAEESQVTPPPPARPPLGCQMPVNPYLRDHSPTSAAATLPDPEQVEPPRAIAGHARPTATANMAAAGPAEAVQQSEEGSKEVEEVAKATAAVTLPEPEQVEPPRVIAGHARPTATAIMAAAGPAEAVQQSEGSKEEEKAAMAAAAAAEASENSIEPQSANEA